jgi:hypothetical protein
MSLPKAAKQCAGGTICSSE